jgi:hypothetical protein
MSANPCDNYTIIMVNFANIWLLHSRVAHLLDGVRLELRELKSRSMLLGACTSYHVLRFDLEASAVEIKDLKHKLDHSSRYSVLSPLCELCGSLKGKLFHVTKENIEFQHEIAYLTTRLEKTILSEKMIEDDLSRIEKSATKFTYKLGVGFERCEDKSEKSAPKFISSSTYNQEEKIIKSSKAHYSSNPKPSFNHKTEVRKETPKLREEVFVCIFCGRAGHLDEFYLRRKRIERRRFDYVRNSYRDEFSDFLPRSLSRTLLSTSSRALPQFAHGPNHRSYGFGSRENRFEPKQFGYSLCPHCGDRFPRRPVFCWRVSHSP